MADLLSTLLGKDSSSNTVTQTTSPEALAALAKAYNINIDQASSPAAAEDIVKQALAKAQQSVTTGAAATRGSGAYSSAALSAAREKAMQEAASAANIEIARTQQQSAAQATQAAQALANATRVTTQGTPQDSTSQMLDIMRRIGTDSLVNSPTSATSAATGAAKRTGTAASAAEGQDWASTLGTKAINYGGKIAQAGLTSAVIKGLAGSVNPLVGAFLGLAASDVIKTGTGSVMDSLMEVFGLKKKAPEEVATAATVDAGMVDFVNAATSAGYDMNLSGTTVDAAGFDESTMALADLMGISPQDIVQGGDLGGGGSDWNDFLSSAETDFKSADQLGYEADRGSLSDTFGGDGNDEYADTRGSLF